MLFGWNSDTIRWYSDAARYTGFFSGVSRLVAPMLQGYRSLCDMGCGLGLVDMELSPYIEHISCIDICPNATAALRKTIDGGEIKNISVRQMDYRDSDETWDVIYLCFFSSDRLEDFLPRCRKMIVVVGGDKNAELFPEKYRRRRKTDISGEESYLQSLKLNYKLSRARLEFGQPLRSKSDAVSFVRTFAADIPDAELEEFLEKRLVETGKKEFPFYMPREKDIGIFEIDGYL